MKTGIRTEVSPLILNLKNYPGVLLSSGRSPFCAVLHTALKISLVGLILLKMILLLALSREVMS
jgi:hypothetical protein